MVLLLLLAQRLFYHRAAGRGTLGETWGLEPLAQSQAQELERPDSAAATDSCRDSARLKKPDAAVYRNDL